MHITLGVLVVVELMVTITNCKNTTLVFERFHICFGFNSKTTTSCTMLCILPRTNSSDSSMIGIKMSISNNTSWLLKGVILIEVNVINTRSNSNISHRDDNNTNKRGNCSRNSSKAEINKRHGNNNINRIAEDSFWKRQVHWAFPHFVIKVNSCNLIQK